MHPHPEPPGVCEETEAQRLELTTELPVAEARLGAGGGMQPWAVRPGWDARQYRVTLCQLRSEAWGRALGWQFPLSSPELP